MYTPRGDWYYYPNKDVSSGPLLKRDDSVPGGNGVSGILVIGLTIIIVCVLVIFIGIVHRRLRAHQARARLGKPQATLSASSALPLHARNNRNLEEASSPPTPGAFQMSSNSAQIPAGDLAHFNFMRPETSMTYLPPPAYSPQPPGLERPSTDADEIVRRHQENNEIPKPFVAFVGGTLDEGSSNPSKPTSPASSTFSWLGHAARPSNATQYTVSVSIGRTGAEKDRYSKASWITSPRSPAFPNPGTLTRRSISGIGDGALSPTLAAPSTVPLLDLSSSHVKKGRPKSRNLSSFRFPRVPSISFTSSSLHSPTVAAHGHGAHSESPSLASDHSFLMVAQHALTQSSTRRKAARDFDSPLLADEIEVRTGDSLCVLETFDDGWCVAILEQSVDGHAEVAMGCVPAWVFEKPARFASSSPPPTRLMRSTSLAVTIELLPNTPEQPSSPNPLNPKQPMRESVLSTGSSLQLAGRGLSPAPRISPLPWQREAVISWSNF